MGRTQRSGRRRAQLFPKREFKGQHEVEQLREENRKLRQLVAKLSKLAVEQIIEGVESEEPSRNDKSLV